MRKKEFGGSDGTESSSCESVKIIWHPSPPSPLKAILKLLSTVKGSHCKCPFLQNFSINLFPAKKMFQMAMISIYRYYYWDVGSISNFVYILSFTFNVSFWNGATNTIKQHILIIWQEMSLGGISIFLRLYNRSRYNFFVLPIWWELYKKRSWELVNNNQLRDSSSASP